MNEFKDLKDMTLESMRAECKKYFKEYDKVTSMPLSIIARIKLLMKEIDKKEAEAKNEEKKSELLKALEAQKSNNEVNSEEIRTLEQQLVGLNIKYLRQKFTQPETKGRGTIKFVNKKK